jgi:hypothetical protein
MMSSSPISIQTNAANVNNQPQTITIPNGLGNVIMVSFFSYKVLVIEFILQLNP